MRNIARKDYQELYSLKREIALSHIATINNEVIALENKAKELEKEKENHSNG